MTLHRRWADVDDVAWTLSRHCINVMCPLGNFPKYSWGTATLYLTRPDTRQESITEIAIVHQMKNLITDLTLGSLHRAGLALKIFGPVSSRQAHDVTQWGTYTPEERYRQFLTSKKYVALTLEMVGWMNSMLIAISPKPLCRRIIKFNKRSWWYSYINLDAIFFYFYMKFLSLWPWPEGHTLYLPTCQI